VDLISIQHCLLPAPKVNRSDRHRFAVSRIEKKPRAPLSQLRTAPNRIMARAKQVGRPRPYDTGSTLFLEQRIMKLSFSAAKGKPNYTNLTAFVRDKLPKFKDGAILEAFFKATGAAGSNYEKAVMWTHLPILQIMPAPGGAMVGYAGDDQLILDQRFADIYEANENGLLGKGGCLCFATTRGNWDTVEIAIVRGVALWGCGVAKISQDEWEKRADQFVDAVFGANRQQVDNR
jgi:hypothetical protein